MVAAAAAWDGLAESLASSASSFVSVTSDLAKSSWQGPSATAMMAVASSYASWLSAAAAQAEATCSQAAAMADAFETAQSATVQPAVVSANRGLLKALASTNHLGQNAPTIMDIESAYEQMWASDVAAMSDYHADASAAVEHLSPWQQVLRDLGFNFGDGRLAGELTGAPPPTGNTPAGFGLSSAHGILHAPSLQTGAGLAVPDGTLTSSHYVTGGVGMANFSSELLNPSTPGTGFGLGAGQLDLLHPV
jgi:PPE-repeat protein